MLAPSVTPFFIGVSGGPCSGKSAVCAKIVNDLRLKHSVNQNDCVKVIALEHFYKPKTAEQRRLASKGNYNLDHPEAFDDTHLLKILVDLRNGQTVKIPRYNPSKYEHTEGDFDIIEPSPVIIVEGILVFYYPKIREFFQLKLFVDRDADIRLARRVSRDMKLYQRTLENILHSYINFVKPSFEDFCLPTKKYADVIVPRGEENNVAVDLIIQHIQDYLENKPKRLGHQYSTEYNARTRPH